LPRVKGIGGSCTKGIEQKCVIYYCKNQKICWFGGTEMSFGMEERISWPYQSRSFSVGAGNEMLDELVCTRRM
jgi:hypothetical protein